MLKLRKDLIIILQTFGLCLLLPFVVIMKRSILAGKQVKLDHSKGFTNYCTGINVSYRGSSKRDAILFSVDKFNKGLELAVKSLRATGSKCRIVVLSAKKIYIPPSALRVFNNLGVELYEDCKNEDPTRDYVPHMLRYEFERQWISKHIKELDRVFHSDAFDVYFQKDPFGPEIKKDEITFVVEPHAFRSCGWNLAWMTDCYGSYVTEKYRTNYIICSGSIIGGADPYLKFLDLMIDQKEWTTCWKPSFDQPIVNFLVWSGIIEKEEIKYKLTGCNGNYLTFQWCLPGIVPFDKNGRITSIAGSVPAFVHQYNRNETLTRQLNRRCMVRRS